MSFTGDLNSNNVIYCLNCGSENIKNAKYCNQCACNKFANTKEEYEASKECFDVSDAFDVDALKWKLASAEEEIKALKLQVEQLSSNKASSSVEDENRALREELEALVQKQAEASNEDDFVQDDTPVRVMENVNGTEYTEICCSNCGGSLKEGENGIYVCDYCGAEFNDETVSYERELFDWAHDYNRSEQLKSLRRNLWIQTHETYINSEEILETCKDILNICPDDFCAMFYDVANRENQDEINEFLDSIDARKNAPVMDAVISFMLKSLRQNNLLSLNYLIERAYKGRDLNRYEKFTTALSNETKKLESGIYDLNIQRDVFVAYSSKDMRTINSLVKRLEDEGLTCFVALRNLQHGRGAVDNYQRALETAMDNCKIIVFISSENSRSYECDAFRRELPYIKRKDIENAPSEYKNQYDKMPMKYKKPRVEYRLDNVTNIVTDRFVKDFFGTLEYCYSAEEVLRRINVYLAEGSGSVDNGNVKFCTVCGSENPKEMKFCGECGNTEFFDTYEEYMKAMMGGESDHEKEEAEKRAREEAERETQALKEQLERMRRLQEEALRHYTPEELEAKRQEEERLRLEEERKQAEAEVLKQGFKVESGVLVQYVGEGGDVEIPPLSKVISAFAFRNSKITSVKIHGEISQISEGAFENCKQLTRVVMEEGVTEIGKGAFMGCESLTQVAIPKTVNKISAHAFEECVGLKAIRLPDIKEIEKYSFAGCEGFTFIELPLSVEKISEGAFAGCSAVNSVNISPNVKVIESEAFSACSALSSINLPSSVQTVGENAFNMCFNLTVYTDARGIKSGWAQDFGINASHVKWGCNFIRIGNNSLYLENGLLAKFIGTGGCITVPVFVKGIGEEAFMGCKNLKSITLHRGVSVVGDRAFVGCSGLEAFIVQDGNPYYSAIGNCLIENKTKKIVAGCKTSVIPQSVFTVGDYAFCGCDTLTQVVIPQNVTKIGANAFAYCSALTSVNIENVRAIGNYAFSHCTALKEIAIPFGLNQMGDKVFENCVELQKVSLPETLREIPNYTFENCSLLKTVNVPSSIRKIGSNAFENCSSLGNVKLPVGLTEIGNYAFANCDGMTEMPVCDTLVSIGNYAFSGCDGITAITLPVNVQKIGDFAFSWCSKIKEITVQEGNALYRSEGNCLIEKMTGMVVKGCSASVIPSGVKGIGDDAFSNCTGLEKLVLPNGVYSIGKSAFQDCAKLSEIYLPDTLSEIGEGAFWDCANLKEIFIPESVEVIGRDAFYGCDLQILVEADSDGEDWEYGWNNYMPIEYGSFRK